MDPRLEVIEKQIAQMLESLLEPYPDIEVTFDVKVNKDEPKKEEKENSD